MTKKNSSARKNRVARQTTGPPPFNATISFTKTFRFTTTAAQTLGLSANDLLDLLVFAGTTTTGYRVAKTVKLHRVSVWAPMPSSLVPTTCSIEYSSGQGSAASSNVVRSDTSMGADMPAYVTASPPQGSTSGFWHTGNDSTLLCFIVTPINSIIDISVTFVLSDDLNVFALQNPTISTTAGNLFIGGLDGLRTGSTNYPPISYETV